MGLDQVVIRSQGTDLVGCCSQELAEMNSGTFMGTNVLGQERGREGPGRRLLHSSRRGEASDSYQCRTVNREACRLIWEIL